jgi:hypothetical protein
VGADGVEAGVEKAGGESGSVGRDAVVGDGEGDGTAGRVGMGAAIVSGATDSDRTFGSTSLRWSGWVGVGFSIGRSVGAGTLRATTGGEAWPGVVVPMRYRL